MERVAGCGEYAGDVLVADWEATGVDSLRADVCVPAVRGMVRPGGQELSSMAVLELCRLGAALIAQRTERAGHDWCFTLRSFTLEWHGLPPSIPALGAIWCELIVEAVAEQPEAGRQDVTWSCTLLEHGRPLVVARLEGWLTSEQPRSASARRESVPGASSAPEVPAPRPMVVASGDGWAVRWDPARASLSGADPDHIPLHALAEAVLSVTRLRSPEGRVSLVEMSFGGVARLDAGLELELTWDPVERVNMFWIRQDGRPVATARVGLLGRESLSIVGSG